MRKLTPPDLIFSNVYDDCIITINSLRKPHFENVKLDIVALTETYIVSAKSQQLHTIPTDTGHPPLKSKDFKYLYTGKMLVKGEVGRKHYEKLMLAAPNQICPYCDYTPVEQLDHVLAKAHYSKLSITPENLVPACGSCNFNKKDKIIGTASDLHLHPYFDEEKTEQWLKAKVIPTDYSITFEYYVQEIDGMEDGVNDRIKTHFKTFKLKNKYEIIAAAEASSTLELVTLYKKSPDLLQEHLNSVADDLLSHRINFWKTAMYCALRDSDWFCQGGVMNIKPDDV